MAGHRDQGLGTSPNTQVNKFEERIKDIDSAFQRRDNSNDVRIRAARAIIDDVQERNYEEDMNKSDRETVKEFEMSNDGQILPKLEILKKNNNIEQLTMSSPDNYHIESSGMAHYPTEQQLQTPAESVKNVSHQSERRSNFKADKVSGYDNNYEHHLQQYESPIEDSNSLLTPGGERSKSERPNNELKASRYNAEDGK